MAKKLYHKSILTQSHKGSAFKYTCSNVLDEIEDVFKKPKYLMNNS